MNHLKASLFMALSSLCIVISDVIMKKNTANSFDILFLRFLFASLILLPFSSKKAININNLIRSILFSSAMFFFLTSLQETSLSTMIVINFSTPIWTTIFSYLLLKENIKHRLLSVLLGFLGIIIAAYPTIESTKINIIMLIIPTFCFALLDIFNKQNQKEPLIEVVFGSSFFSTLIFAPFFSYTLPSNFFIFPILGINSNLILLFLIKAMKNSEISALQPIKYIELPISIYFGYLFFNEILDIYKIIGILILILSIYINFKKEIKNSTSKL